MAELPELKRVYLDINQLGAEIRALNDDHFILSETTDEKNMVKKVGNIQRKIADRDQSHYATLTSDPKIMAALQPLIDQMNGSSKKDYLYFKHLLTP